MTGLEIILSVTIFLLVIILLSKTRNTEENIEVVREDHDKYKITKPIEFLLEGRTFQVTGVLKHKQEWHITGTTISDSGKHRSTFWKTVKPIEDGLEVNFVDKAVSFVIRWDRLKEIVKDEDTEIKS